MRPVGSKYLLEEPLGRGATGTVWRGRQREEAAGDGAAVAGAAGEVVAIKVLKEELAHDPDVVMRFLRERSVLLRLTHRNIVRTRDLVVEGDLLALVMDLIDGPDLHRYLRENGPFSPVGAALVTAQIADALAASHADGVVHRDLKPANVLLASGTGDDFQLRPMLTDFGIARLADSPGLTRTHEFVGTPAYVAPESAEGRPQTSAVDIYGAGILLYELVTGRPPFGGGSPLEVLHRHLSEEPRRPEQVPEPLWTVLERCLRKSPEQRPSAESLARALRTVAAGLQTGAAPEQVQAALGVAALLAPDRDPTAVPGSGSGDGTPGAADATQVLPAGSGGGFDPNAATSVLPQQGPPGRPDAEPTVAIPSRPDDDAPRREDPHPWQNQLRAARDRNEQTQVQPLDPDQDPLRRRPPRRSAPPPEPQYQQQPPPPPQQPQQYRGRPPEPYGGQQYGGQAPPPQRYTPPPPPQPQRYEPQPPPERARREPRAPRQRSANPMRIPGLGCLKGCLFMVLILVVICFLVWNFTPLQDWIAEGKSFWEATKDWFGATSDWVGDVMTWIGDLISA